MKSCLPLIFYIFSIIVGLFVSYYLGGLTKRYTNESEELDIPAISSQIFGYVLCCLILQYLCNNNHMTLAWFIVLLPCICTSALASSLGTVIKK